MDYQSYALLGIAAAGLIANEIIDYKNSQSIKKYVGRFKELTNQAQEMNTRFNSQFSKLIETKT